MTTPSRYETALEKAWATLLDWLKSGRFTPGNEEDIQCFLYFALVTDLGTATGVRPKATTGKPPSIYDKATGILNVGNMHFPDLALGDDPSNPDVVVEIKYRREARGTFYNSCKLDIAKLKSNHDHRKHYFVLFDANAEHVFMDAHQHSELSGLASTNCKILHHPSTLNTSPHKARARRAVGTMRDAGLDFRAMGKKNSIKKKLPTASS
jgi:hypothetical protein